MGKEIRYITNFFILIVISITILIGSSLALNINQEHETARELAKVEALGSYNKDLVFRRWASKHGGVYVPITDSIKPNPHLNFLGEQNVTTTDGKKLTLINPAYMTRLVFQLGAEQYGQKGHITSLNPIRPENKADEWETKALKRFEKGETEYSSIEKIDDKDYMRLMQPMFVEQSCLKCHSDQGYKLGDIRGGISVSIPVSNYENIVQAKIKSLTHTHLLSYLVIIFFSTLGYRRIIIEMKKRNKAQKIILHNETILLKQNNDLRIAKEKAIESDRLKTVFLQNMSHEIRTPMNAIMGFSSLLPAYFDDKKCLKEYSNIIMQRCDDLLCIINDILDISKIESEQVTKHIEECKLEDVINSITYFFTEEKNRQEKDNISLNITNQDSDNFTFHADYGKLNQILNNLISNAIKFTDEGFITIGFKINEKEQLEFYVSDTGIGIHKKDQELIFERFAQVEQGANRIYGGTGLGLSIVTGLTDSLSGSIHLKSEPNKGSTFTVCLPQLSASTKSPSQNNTKSKVNFDFTNKNILIVEDDMPNAKYLQEVFNNTSANILVAHNGSDAIEIAKQTNLDIILMDIRLPDLSGYEVTQQIRKENKEVSIIAQTAYASGNDRQQAYDSGCNEYLSKPVKSKKLLAVVNKYLTETVIS